MVVDLLKRIAFGFVWWIVLFFAIMIAGGAIAGLIGSFNFSSLTFNNNPMISQAIGVKFAQDYSAWVLIITFGLASYGTFFGWLPGTQYKPSSEKKSSSPATGKK